MNSGVTHKLSLESLADGIPVITHQAHGFYKENCMVCFHRNGHRSGLELRVRYEDYNRLYEVCWSGDVTEQLLKNFAKVPKVTEDAACAIALFLVRELTEFTGVEMSSLGTTIDYYLAPQNQDDDLIFNRAARLEATGILKENPQNTVEGRIKQKLGRLKPERDLPTFIVVVEFSKPWSKIVKHE